LYLQEGQGDQQESSEGQPSQQSQPPAYDELDDCLSFTPPESGIGMSSFLVKNIILRLTFEAVLHVF
jgi:hypothetical protein